MSVGNPTLGTCAPIHTASIQPSCGDQDLFTIPLQAICEGRYNAVLDDIGEAYLQFRHDECARGFSICPGRHYLVIKRNSCVVFKGPILRIEYERDTCQLIAADPLWWLTRRVYSPGDGGDGFATPIQMFEQLLLADVNGGTGTEEFGGCEQAFTPLCFSYAERIDGGEEALAPNPDPSDNHTTKYSLLQEFADSFLDYVVMGDEIYYGYGEVPIPKHLQQRRPKLTNESWCETPRIVQDVEDFFTDVFLDTGVDTENQTLAPPFYDNGTYRQAVCCNQFGVHQGLFDYSELEGVGEVQAAAAAELTDSCSKSAFTYVDSVDGAVLSPDVAWDVPRMLPGMLVDVCLDVGGAELNETLRLLERTVEFSPIGEQVSVGLGPL